MTGTAHRGRRPALHLLWAAPVAALLSLIQLAWVAEAWCRQDLCSVDGPSLAGALISAAAVVVFWTAAVGGVPWTPRAGLRVAVAIAVGLAAAVVVLLVGTGGFALYQPPVPQG